jgi:hypothetical protein
MTEHDPIPTREHSSHPSPLSIDPSRTEDVDPTEDFVEMPATDAPVDSLAAHPQTKQLPPRHYPMLSPRKLGHCPVPFASR